MGIVSLQANNGAVLAGTIFEYSAAIHIHLI